MKIICALKGHNWLGRGWQTDTTNPAIPRGIFWHLYTCSRCQTMTHVAEYGAQLQARFDGYRDKYGDAMVAEDHEFMAPRPSVR